MSKKLKPFAITAILGIMAGGLMGISIRYPVTPETMKVIEETCQQQAFTRFKVGITGKVYEVTCPNGRTYIIK